MQTVERSQPSEGNSRKANKNIHRKPRSPRQTEQLGKDTLVVIFDASEVDPSSDPVQIYLNEISKNPLIKRAEEIYLRKKCGFATGE